MRWEEIEDKICSLIFLKNHVIKNRDVNFSVQEALEHGVDKLESSIKMRFSNIVAACHDLNIIIPTKMGSLSNYAKQTYNELQEVKNYSLLKIYEELEKIRTASFD